MGRCQQGVASVSGGCGYRLAPQKVANSARRRTPPAGCGQAAGSRWLLSASTWPAAMRVAPRPCRVAAAGVARASTGAAWGSPSTSAVACAHRMGRRPGQRACRRGSRRSCSSRPAPAWVTARRCNRPAPAGYRRAAARRRGARSAGGRSSTRRRLYRQGSLLHTSGLADRRIPWGLVRSGQDSKGSGDGGPGVCPSGGGSASPSSTVKCGRGRKPQALATSTAGTLATRSFHSWMVSL
jgi:hypothetical protein